MSKLKRGDGPPPASQPVRSDYLDLSPLASLRRTASDPIPPDDPDSDPFPDCDGDGDDGEPPDTIAIDPADWPDWTEEDCWTIAVDAEDLDESDPPLPLFLRKAPTGGGN